MPNAGELIYGVAGAVLAVQGAVSPLQQYRVNWAPQGKVVRAFLFCCSRLLWVSDQGVRWLIINMALLCWDFVMMTQLLVCPDAYWGVEPDAVCCKCMRGGVYLHLFQTTLLPYSLFCMDLHGKNESCLAAVWLHSKNTLVQFNISKKKCFTNR